ncbi:hypothetical protein, partial [Aestuariivirga sp.]|uniref:hypothetical protein n=1 Tax=Aestuariivirga sp. TaxID=2650926 RepID=UPI0025C549E9
LNPLSRNTCGNVDKAPPCPQSHRRTKDKKRTFDVLPKPDKLISYRQGQCHCPCADAGQAWPGIVVAVENA